MRKIFFKFILIILAIRLAVNYVLCFILERPCLWFLIESYGDDLCTLLCAWLAWFF